MSDSEPGLGEDNGPPKVQPSAQTNSRPVTLQAHTPLQDPSSINAAPEAEVDEFGLSVRKRSISARATSPEPANEKDAKPEAESTETQSDRGSLGRQRSRSSESNGTNVSLETAPEEKLGAESTEHVAEPVKSQPPSQTSSPTHAYGTEKPENTNNDEVPPAESPADKTVESLSNTAEPIKGEPALEGSGAAGRKSRSNTLGHSHTISKNAPAYAVGGVSEWSHQALAPRDVQTEEQAEEEWQDMPALGKYDIYDDDGNLVARGAHDSDDEDAYEGLGGAGKGYTRVQIDDDAKSATSMDENTNYLFPEKGTHVQDEDEEQRDPLAQMQATKDMLTEGQRIAYVGVVRVAMAQMVKSLEDLQVSIHSTKANKKELGQAIESLKMWSQKMMVRLYAHMDIDSSEQVMIEQLTDHGVQPSDLTPVLKINSRVKNPMGPDTLSRSSVSSPGFSEIEGPSSPPPPYELHSNEPLPEVRTPTMLARTREIDIDLRWTVLCDLFLVLIADSVYDARSRVLLERVGEALDITWMDICRFEKRVTDALEMQEAAQRETWDEASHMENRRKLALKRKYMLMGLATVGGSLVIGLSAGILAPLIGAGLAAGFTTIGVAGTGGFLAGAGGTALITTGAALSGGTIAVRASNRRMGAVKTFEYRPLQNNKRVNLIVTISGWMNGKVDDVRLPFSTIDPIMGDIYSVLWEPDMLQSMGDTIRILATEALTQGLQQILAATVLTALMASLTLPIVLTKLSYLIDNPWAVSLDRADAAGLILADSLIDRNLGARPITLVGFSLGSRVIFSCLRELAKRGGFGLVQNAYLFGSPVVIKKEEYLRARTVVSGRFVNGYAGNDWILGYLFRATSGGISRIAGLAPIDDVSGVENFNVTELVNGHMAYRAAIPRLLREVGWQIESDVFTEIEDPDPENHEARQRELIREIDEARKEVEAKPEKRKFGLFRTKKLAEKKAWETYDEKSKAAPDDGNANETNDKRDSRVLFDIDAIRAELESEQMEVRQLESTLPPMRLDLGSPPPKVVSTEKILQTQFPNLRATKSYDGPALPAYLERDASAAHHDLNNDEEVEFKVRNLDEEREQLNGESHVKLTFDPPPLPSAALAWQTPTPSHTDSPIAFQRPVLKSAATLPITPVMNLEHNAWADEDEDFGQEREIKMMFE